MPTKKAKMGPKPVKQQKRQQPKQQKKTQSVVAPQTRAVRATVPNSARKQEMVIEVTKDTALTYTLHPQNIPWLGQVAPSFQKWGLQNLKVWYEPRVSSATNGTVSMGFLSDFKDAIPSSLRSLTSLTGATRGPPWATSTLSCPKFRTYEYVSLDNISDEDKNGRALGRIVVLADMDSSFSASDIVGRVYIEYTPVLLEPTDPNLQKALVGPSLPPTQ